MTSLNLEIAHMKLRHCLCNEIFSKQRIRHQDPTEKLRLTTWLMLASIDNMKLQLTTWLMRIVCCLSYETCLISLNLLKLLSVLATVSWQFIIIQRAMNTLG